MSTYNLTPYVTSTNLVELALATDTTLGGHMFGTFVLVVVFSVAFLMLKSKGMFTPESAVTAMWLTMLVVILLRPMGLIGNAIFWGVILLTAVLTSVLYLSGTSE